MQKTGYKKLIYYLIIYLALSFGIIYFSFNKKYLIFNLGLSFIPFILTTFCVNNKEKAGICTIFTLIAIAFYPNAIYMFTDLIHIKTHDFYTVQNGLVNYNLYYLSWVKLCIEVTIVLMSIILSYESFINILIILRCYKHKIASGILLIFFSIITGIAIYIGRFLRFNSWDIFKIHKIATNMLLTFNYNDYILIALFAGLHLLVTILFLISHNE